MNSITRMTKTTALRSLGVADGRDIRRLSSLVDLAHVGAGQVLVGPRTPRPTVHVGLDGTIVLVDGSGLAPLVRAPFVLDLWADEIAARGDSSVTAETRLTVLMIDWTSRETMFREVPHLRLLSRDTERRLRLSRPA